MPSEVGRREACEQEVSKHRHTFTDVSHVSAERLKLMIEQGPVTIVDVRSPEERAVSMLPGAVSLEEMPLPPDDRPLVLYCTVGFRSSLEARRLAPAADVHSMGGILEWVHAGGTLVDPANGCETRRLHAFGSKWAAMAPEDCEVLVFEKTLSAAYISALLRVPAVWAMGVLGSWSGGSRSPQQGGTQAGGGGAAARTSE